MKKVLKAIGLILVVLAIYLAAQVFVTLIIGVVHVIRVTVSSAVSNTTPDIGVITDDLMQFIGAQTPWVLFVAVALALPSYYLIYRGRKQELGEFVRLGSLHPISVPVLVVFGLSLNFIVDMLLGLLSQIDIFSQLFETYNQVAELIFNGGFVLSLLAVGIVGPIFEELLFRGLVFGELRKIMHVRLAIVLQALIFGVYHMNAVQGAYAFLIGILLGYIYYRSSSIIAPMIVHIAINSSSVIITRFLRADMLENYAGAIVIASLLLFVLTGAFILLSRSFRHVMDNGLYEKSRTALPPPADTGVQD